MVRKKELEGLSDEFLQAYNSAGFTKPSGSAKFFDSFNLWRNKECNFLVGEYSQFRICAKKTYSEGYSDDLKFLLNHLIQYVKQGIDVATVSFVNDDNILKLRRINND